MSYDNPAADFLRGVARIPIAPWGEHTAGDRLAAAASPFGVVTGLC